MTNHNYKHSLIIFLLFIVNTLGVSLTVQAQDWQKLKKGISYKKLSITNSNGSTTLHTFKISPYKTKIKPIITKPKSNVKDMAIKNQAFIAINANFFDEQGLTLGLVKKDRKVLHPIKKISWWSVFCVRHSGVSIIPSKQVRDGYCHQAIEAGPRLVINGSTPKLKPNFSKKTAIGIDRKGFVILAVSQSAMSIQSLADTFQKSESQGGLDCPNALNLDGGSSTQLYAKFDDFELNLPSYMTIPVALGVYSK